jgi:hypothetical protein
MTDLTGVVEATSNTGLRIDASWFSKSKFRPVALPPVGTSVKLEVDAKNFFTSLEVLDGLAEAAKTTGREWHPWEGSAGGQTLEQIA